MTQAGQFLPEAWEDPFPNATDVDAHELVPSHFWGEVFGPVAGRIADLVDVYLRERSKNGIFAPDVTDDSLPITDENVWSVRSARSPGAFDFRRRLDVLDLMGTRMQLVFPGYALLAGLFVSADATLLRDRYLSHDIPTDEIREIGREGLREHNVWASRTTSIAPERFCCVAYLVPDRGVDTLMSEVRDLISSGIRAVNLPTGMPPAGLSPADPELDVFWAFLAEADVPLVFHVGGEFGFLNSPAWGRAPAFNLGKSESIEIGLEPFSLSTIHLSVSTYLAAMVLGGVFERHPRLRCGVIELGAQWFGPLANTLDLWGDVFRSKICSVLSEAPSTYLARNVRVTPFNSFEPIAEFFRRYPKLTDCFCYSTDYPHVEGGKDIKRRCIDALSPLGRDVMEKYFVTNGQLLVPNTGG
jgi:predicted TIM-barrel fold metal-dependent hydrolase